MRVARYKSRRKSLKNPAAVQLVATRTSPRDPSVKNPPHAAQLQQCVSISLCPRRILCHRVAMLAENMRAVAFAWFDLCTAGGWCNKPKLESVIRHLAQICKSNYGECSKHMRYNRFCRTRLSVTSVNADLHRPPFLCAHARSTILRGRWRAFVSKGNTV